MKITSKQALEIIYEDDPDWTEVKKTRQLTFHSRWSVGYSQIFENISTGKFYKINWSVGATEMQDEHPFGYMDEVEIYEVELVEELVKVWKEIKNETI